jgi:hypothetical protein
MRITMLNLYKPALDLAKAIIDKVPPWVWAVLVLGGLWLASLYGVYRFTTYNAEAACTAKVLIVERKAIDDLSTNRMDISNLKDAHCQLRANLAACQATLAAKPVPPKVVVRRVPVREPEPEMCDAN